jgi:hypothetical protein
MIVAIQQPEHLPWIGFFNKMAQCDKFVLLDHVQFKKNYFENRNRIKTANGPIWITVPVRLKGKFGQSMLEVEVGHEPRWKKRYLKTLEQNYSKAPFWKDVRKIVWPALENEEGKLVDINIRLIEGMVECLQIKTPLIRSSTLEHGSVMKQDLVLTICKKMSADIYISGPDGRNYLNLKDFNFAGIQVNYHDFKHPIYPQQFGEFISHLSAIDLIANCGLESRQIVRECYRVPL